MGLIAAAAGTACASLAAGIALGAAGDLDPSFDGDGVARTDLTGVSAVHDIAIQADGKIVAAGNSDIANDDQTAIARYTAVGAPDTSFGGGDGELELNQIAATPENAVVVRPSGPIILAGSLDSGGDPTMAVAQHTAGTGGLDIAAWPPAGFHTASFGGMDSAANDLVLEANGAVVAVGYADTSTQGDNFAAFRVSEDGATLTEFGASGVNVAGNVGNPGGDDRAEAAAIDPSDGDIILAGNVDPTAADGGSNDDNNIAVARFTPAGVLDGGGFGGGDGISMVDIGDSDTAADVAIQPDGKILVTGTRQPVGGGAQFDHFVMRLHGGGAIDTGFGGGGNGVFVQSAVSPLNGGRALLLLPGGKIVVGGETIGGTSDWVVARYTSAGLPDTSFDGDGSRTYSFPAEVGDLSSLALQPDGRVLVGGAIGGDFAVARLEADPVPAQPATPGGTGQTPKKKKCKKGRKLKKGKCVKKKRKKR